MCRNFKKTCTHLNDWNRQRTYPALTLFSLCSSTKTLIYCGTVSFASLFWSPFVAFLQWHRRSARDTCQLVISLMPITGSKKKSIKHHRRRRLPYIRILANPGQSDLLNYLRSLDELHRQKPYSASCFAGSSTIWFKSLFHWIDSNLIAKTLFKHDPCRSSHWSSDGDPKEEAGSLLLGVTIWWSISSHSTAQRNFSVWGSSRSTKDVTDISLSHRLGLHGYPAGQQ